MKDLLSQLLDAAMAVKMEELGTTTIGRIETYDHTQQRASVKPLLNRKLLDGRVEELPVLPNVPVWFPRSGGASMTMPVRRGDTGILAISDRSLEEWKSSGGVQTPRDPRMHEIVDAVILMGIIDFRTGSLSENNDDVLITYSGNNIRLKPNGNIEIESSTEVRVITPHTQFTGAVTIDGLLTYKDGLSGEGGAVITGGTVTHNGKNVGSDHKHSGVESGPSNTGDPI